MAEQDWFASQIIGIGQATTTQNAPPPKRRGVVRRTKPGASSHRPSKRDPVGFRVPSRDGSKGS